MIFDIKCAWCGKFLGIKITDQQVNNQIALFKTSHGICGECKRKVMDSVMDSMRVQSINHQQEIKEVEQ